MDLVRSSKVSSLGEVSIRSIDWGLQAGAALWQEYAPSDHEAARM